MIWYVIKNDKNFFILIGQPSPMKIKQRRGKKKRKTKERGLPNKMRVLVPNFKEAKMIRA